MKCWRHSSSSASKKVRKAYPQLLLALLIITMIAACSGAAVNLGKMPSPELSSTPCRVVQHRMGETCVPNNPQRVVTLLHHMLGHVLILGVKPIGSNVRSVEQLNRDYLSVQTYLGNKTEGIQLLGIESQVNLEKLLRLKPDLILASESEGSYLQLSQIAPVVIVPVEDVLLNWKKGFNVIVDILGKPEEAQQALDRYYQRVEKLKIALGDRYQNQTISVVGSNGSAMYAFTQNDFSGSILSDLGLKRPEAQQQDTPNGVIYNLSEETLEQVIEGDVIFFLSFEKEGRAAFERLQKRPLWKKLKAVQKGQVYLVNGYTWTGSNLLAADAVIDDLFKYLVNPS